MFIEEGVELHPDALSYVILYGDIVAVRACIKAGADTYITAPGFSYRPLEIAVIYSENPACLVLSEVLSHITYDKLDIYSLVGQSINHSRPHVTKKLVEDYFIRFGEYPLLTTELINLILAIKRRRLI